MGRRDTKGSRVAGPPPSSEILRAFSAAGDRIALAGGEGLSFRVGAVVLKRVHDAAEAEWTQDLLSRVRQAGFRLPDPLRTVDGCWTHHGWSASRFIPGLVPLAPDWRAVMDAGLRFADAGERARAGGEEVLEGRTHRWAVADRVAWGEASAALDPRAQVVVDEIEAWLRAPSLERHLAHGDLSGNVFLDPSGVPVILDVSPYLRPRRWAEAIVVADAVAWHGASVDLASQLAGSDAGRDLFGRALIFRLVAEQLADSPHVQLEPYRRILSHLA